MSTDAYSALFADHPKRTAVERELRRRFGWSRPVIDLERDEDGRAVDWRWAGGRGYGYAISDSTMGVVVESRQVSGFLRRQERWDVSQDGDDETTFLVPDADFPEFAKRV